MGLSRHRMLCFSACRRLLLFDNPRDHRRRHDVSGKYAPVLSMLSWTTREINPLQAQATHVGVAEKPFRKQYRLTPTELLSTKCNLTSNQALPCRNRRILLQGKGLTSCWLHASWCWYELKLQSRPNLSITPLTLVTIPRQPRVSSISL